MEEALEVCSFTETSFYHLDNAFMVKAYSGESALFKHITYKNIYNLVHKKRFCQGSNIWNEHLLFSYYFKGHMEIFLSSHKQFNNK